MNYIQQINYFWSKHESHSFGTTEIALYFHLLDICNKCAWTNPFKRRNTKICGDLGISEPTLEKTRNKLHQRGMIGFDSKGKGGNISYELLFAAENETKNPNYFGTSFGSSVGTSFGSSFNLNINSKPKTETKTFVDDAGYARAAKIENAINEYAGPKHLEGEKEKKVPPKKEKRLPTLQEALQEEKLTGTAHWRNVAEHHQVDAVARSELFKIFYEQQEDHYQIVMPTWTEMAKHFYNWVPIHQNKATLNNLRQISDGKVNTKHNGPNGNRNNGAAAAKDERSQIAARSAEVLSKLAGKNEYGDIQERESEHWTDVPAAGG